MLEVVCVGGWVGWWGAACLSDGMREAVESGCEQDN